MVNSILQSGGAGGVTFQPLIKSGAFNCQHQVDRQAQARVILAELGALSQGRAERLKRVTNGCVYTVVNFRISGGNLAQQQKFRTVTVKAPGTLK